MPQRVNTKSDIGTSKIASDSYDTNNIFLTDQGWVYRHWKGNPDDTDARYWDEIIVAGEVTDPGDPDYGVVNTPIEPTKYTGTGEGSQKYHHTLTVGSYEPITTPGTPGTPGSLGDPDKNFDIQYAEHTYDGDVVAKEVVAPGQARFASYAQFPEDTVPADDSDDSDPGDGGNGGGTTPAPSDVTLEFTGADGTSSYTSAGGANASVSIEVGGTLTITNNTGGHPVDVRVSDGGATVSEGTLTGAPAGPGESLTWDTTGVTPGTYYYQCTAHAAMIGTITVTA